ncbi:helix-turn-helix domain-containing protein [Desulfofundulus thermobenzoicus]|uniref:Helix-turn-helix domain-containing protein n=1 Tax=Desulfofundulus thermobenzoicus TaxID=29376 RepID=A0A6N7IU15_9FIRM|nr:helix-turn-helix transcriptional regulator [Desulfofundulus thermobenzoicus]MQL53625.1 helix-turn-helix domain-containing protein [Desulfofundulus thermobenzoicus]
MDTPSRIKQLRQQLGISRSALARKSGISLTYLNEIERGIKSPTEHTLRKLCSALGLSLAEFFAGDGQGEELPADVRRMIAIARQLTPRQRQLLLEVMEEWLANNQG